MARDTGDILEHFVGERQRYTMDWRKDLQPESSAYPARAYEKVVTSTWVIDPDSPTATGISIVEQGFQETLGASWCSVEVDTSVADGAVFWITNTIETDGLQPVPPLTEKTSTQKIVRRYRVRVKE